MKVKKSKSEAKIKSVLIGKRRSPLDQPFCVRGDKRKLLFPKGPAPLKGNLHISFFDEGAFRA